jgi:DNA-binding NarL/FixJ family response regulator
MHQLTPRQRQITDLQGQGLAQKQIADRLNLSLSTVKTHLSRAHARTGTRSGIEMQAGIHGRQMEDVHEDIRIIESVSKHADALLKKRASPC